MKAKAQQNYADNTWTWWMKLMTPVAQENIRQIHGEGGVMALGVGRSDGPSVHREMELLSAAGIPAADVIRIATFNGARFLGVEDKLGSIAEGKLAGMVLLDGDPLKDINHTKQINRVIKNGLIIDRSKLDLPVNQ